MSSNINGTDLEKRCSQFEYKSGALTVLMSGEEAMVVEGLIAAGKRGFAAGKHTLASLIS